MCSHYVNFNRIMLALVDVCVQHAGIHKQDINTLWDFHVGLPHP